MAVGAIVLALGGKGGRRHRQLGWVYVGAMTTVNVTAFLIYRLFGTFGPFHVAAVISLTGIVVGTWVARRARAARLARNPHRRAGLIESHYWWMTFSYAGLIAAFASETITRYDALRAVVMANAGFGAAVGIATAVVTTVSAIWIVRVRRAALAPFAPR
ncbi:MAG: hypothetical protein KF709_03695 [Gemmatimonadaceae bacterium]|nr:hypothetical protein [Gemmatimonadaceae bacterium]